MFARIKAADWTLRRVVAEFGSARGGATAIEFGLIAAGIAVAIIAAVFALGDE